MILAYSWPNIVKGFCSLSSFVLSFDSTISSPKSRPNGRKGEDESLPPADGGEKAPVVRMSKRAKVRKGEAEEARDVVEEEEEERAGDLRAEKGASNPNRVIFRVFSSQIFEKGGQNRNFAFVISYFFEATLIIFLCA